MTGTAVAPLVDVLRRDLDVLEHRRTAAGQSLAEPVPVVGALHSRRIGADADRHLFIRPDAADRDPVGEESSGAVVLRSVEQPVLAQSGAGISERRVAEFAGGVADQDPTGDLSPPA